MADLGKPQETGGGEGTVPPTTTASDASLQDNKSAETVVSNTAISEAITATPAEAKPEDKPEVKTEQKVEGKVEPKVEDKAETKVEEKPVEPKPVESSPPAATAEAAAPTTAEVPTTESAKPAPVEPAAVETAVVAPQSAPPAPVEPIADENANVAQALAQATAAPESGDWQQRELELLKKIEDLEKVKTERSEDSLRLELKVREEEIDLLKARVKNLETELQAALSKPNGKNHEMIENIKQQHEELLSKARGMIFDKTKMVKNQELQIEALTTQVASLKDINQITKDLLEIRNSEIKAMEERFVALEGRFKGEKERYSLVLQRAQTSSNINDDLKKEYETQLAIFKELREKYEQRVQALVAENNRLKESLGRGGPSS